MRFTCSIALIFCLLLALTPAQAQRPSFADLMGRGDKALAAGDTDKAILLYEKLAAFYPNSAEAHNKLGFAHYKKGNDPRALYSFRRSLALSRNNDGALHNLILASGRHADTLARESRFVEAGRNLDELIADYSWHPQYAVLLYYRGRLEFLRGQPEDGLAWWKKAAAAAPESGVAKVVSAQSKPLDAKTVALYKEAGTKVKTEPAFDYLLGSRLLKAGRAAEASQAFAPGLDKCRAANIPFPLLSLEAGEAALAAGDPASATRILEEARLQRPDWASLRTLLWAAYLTAGNQALADQTLQDAFEIDGKPKLALLGDSASPVRLTTSAGSMQLVAVNAVSPSVGKATLAVGKDAPVALDVNPGDAFVYRINGGQLSLQSQTTLARKTSAEAGLAPAMVARDRRGTLYRLADALLKRPIVIVFWSANGTNPLQALSGLGGLEARYGDNLETVAVHTNPSSQKDALRLYLSQPSTFAQLWGDKTTGTDFGVSVSPAVVLIDRSGRIVLRELSPTDAFFANLPATIDALP